MPIKLYGKVEIRGDGEPILVCVTFKDLPLPARHGHIRVRNGDESRESDFGYEAILTKQDTLPSHDSLGVKYVVHLPKWLSYLSEGDIVRINPKVSYIHVLYRATSDHNSLLVTEQCNSNCIMCSQPPKDKDDSYIVRELIQLVRMIPRTQRTFGITGGEPLLAGEQFIELLYAITQNHPDAPIHVLTNGRLFSYLQWAEKIVDIECSNLMFGIPLYSDLSERHDFIVQARGAYDQTIRGILNLKRCGLAVEIRNVLHKQTYSRLVQFAEFIARNLPMVDHVALMGLEGIGYTKMNLEALWIDPVEYREQLAAAVHILEKADIQTSVYNLQLCIIDRSIWKNAVKSISDWKNEYDEICDTCELRNRCAGFFSSGMKLKSKYISPLLVDELELVSM